MHTFDSKYLADFWATLEGWQDSRILTREDAYTLYLFTDYIVNLLDMDGLDYVGHSFRVKKTLSVLVIKTRQNEDSLVTFVSGRCLLNCYKIFLRRLAEGTVEWREDKFA